MEKYVPYIKVNVVYNTSPNGFTDIKNLDSLFVGFQARDKVLLKVDLLYNLLDVIERETLDKYRPIVYGIVSGNINTAEQLSECMTALYVDDVKFKEFVSTQYYLESSDVAFGFQLIQSLLDSVRSAEQRYKTFLKKYGYKVFLTSNGYLYFAVDDLRRPIKLLEGMKCEVLSNAKNWNGDFVY